MRYIGLVVCLLLPLVAMADIYKWADAKGIVHFTDTPLPGATEVNLADDSSTADEITSLPSKETAASPVLTPPKTANATPAAAQGDYYKQLTIVQPLTDASYFNNRGEVELIIATKPEFRAEDKAVILIDGTPMPTTRNAMILRVQNVERGSHTAQVQIEDKSGKVLINSSSITLHMHRATVNSPANKASLPLHKEIQILPTPLTPAKK